ncbi:Arginyl-tRNA synthetase [hydrothermal vent metagenome]|uniref:arginine--tRNA ligase n=1 Tax=hydrothermal vent metagenome TaxID=652676 RepID=A0A3B1B3N2_9ZZZZ
MKNAISEALQHALSRCQQNGSLPADLVAKIQVDHARDKQHGDFATNLAMTLAKAAKQKPRELAELIVANLPDSDVIEKVEIAGPGFINFYIKADAQSSVIENVLSQQEEFGLADTGKGKKIQIEFVSANPTGPLHVGHGRGAAYGAAVANLLKAIGYEVHCEYYVNDAGRQMNILAASVWLRYLELCSEDFPFPVNGYKGDYVLDIAAALHRENGDKMYHSWADISRDLPKDEPQGDKEKYIDAVIDTMKARLHPDQYNLVFDLGLNYILDDIRDDLEHFGVVYDKWFSERSLTDSGDVTVALERLQKSGHSYEKDGATWFRSSDFGDEKDRVLVRDNGQTTYFASDIAYHMNKLERGYDRVIDIWGADHHGYVPRVKAALQALGDDPDKLDVLLVQFAVLYRGGEKIQMSTRSGQFVTLRHLRKEIGSDAARFFYVMRKCEQHMDFDLDLAMSQSNENPMYYIQYAHARVCSVFSQLKDKGFEFDQANGLAQLDKLTESHENDLITRLSRYPEVIMKAGQQHEPHQLVHFLRDLANEFHTYYNAHQFIVDDKNIRDARLCLITAARHVIANGLKLLGVSAPEKM